jgi:hypothetical protein
MASLASSIGSSTCNYGSKTLNRSAYWAPAVLDSNGFARNADWIAVYYKRPMASSPRCTTRERDLSGHLASACRTRSGFVFGWDQTQARRARTREQAGIAPASGGAITQPRRRVPIRLQGGRLLWSRTSPPRIVGTANISTPGPPLAPSVFELRIVGLPQVSVDASVLIPQNESKDRMDRDRRHVRNGLGSPAFTPPPVERSYEARRQARRERCTPTTWSSGSRRPRRCGKTTASTRVSDCSGGDLGNGLQLAGAGQPSYRLGESQSAVGDSMPDMLP